MVPGHSGLPHDSPRLLLWYPYLCPGFPPDIRALRQRGRDVRAEPAHGRRPGLMWCVYCDIIRVENCDIVKLLPHSVPTSLVSEHSHVLLILYFSCAAAFRHFYILSVFTLSISIISIQAGCLVSGGVRCGSRGGGQPGNMATRAHCTAVHMIV